MGWPSSRDNERAHLPSFRGGEKESPSPPTDCLDVKTRSFWTNMNDDVFSFSLIY